MAKTDRGVKISGYVLPSCLAELKRAATERGSTVEAVMEWAMARFAVHYHKDLHMPGLRLDGRALRWGERKPVRTLKGRTANKRKARADQ